MSAGIGQWSQEMLELSCQLLNTKKIYFVEHEYRYTHLKRFSNNISLI